MIVIYKFLLVIVLVVINGRSKPSGEYNYDNYIIFLISYDCDFTCIVTLMNYYDDTTSNENKSNDEVSNQYMYFHMKVHLIHMYIVIHNLIMTCMVKI